MFELKVEGKGRDGAGTSKTSADTVKITTTGSAQDDTASGTFEDAGKNAVPEETTSAGLAEKDLSATSGKKMSSFNPPRTSTPQHAPRFRGLGQSAMES